jgi:hypothetical protein
MSAPTKDWFGRQVDARKRFMRAVGARIDRGSLAYSLAPVNGLIATLSRHFWAGRTAAGSFCVSEVWASPFEVRIAAMRSLRALGWRVALLPTRFSTRAVGERQPVVLVPPGSDVDPKVIHSALEAANFEGCLRDGP